MPRSRATCSIGRSDSNTSRTARSFNSIAADASAAEAGAIELSCEGQYAHARVAENRSQPFSPPALPAAQPEAAPRGEQRLAHDFAGCA